MATIYPLVGTEKIKDTYDNINNSLENLNNDKAETSALTSGLASKANLAGTNTFTGVNTFTSPLITNGAINFNAPEGFMVNGKIVPSVASGNLTLTLTGTSATLSATNPCYVMVGGVTRTITADIVVTANSGTLYLNAGSAELATKEIDYFSYCQWNTTTSAVNLLASRLPYAGTMADFNNSNTNEKGAIGIINYNSTNAVVNIGRFAATLSAGAGYTWSIPTYTASNLIQRPIYETRWLDWVPTIVYNGTSPSGTEIRRTKYRILDTSVSISLHQEWPVAGVGNSTVTATLPMAEKTTFLTDGLTGGLNIGTGAGYGASNGSTVQCRGGTTRTIGTSINSNTFVVAGTYEI